MKWWEYLMVWRWVDSWWTKRTARRLKEAQVESRFQALFSEAEERRGDLTEAVTALREDRERRQTASIRKPRLRLDSQTKPVIQE